MTDDEYLEARGWIYSGDGDEWLDYAGTFRGKWRQKAAVIIQQARDAVEERAAWVQFCVFAVPEDADKRLARYKERFHYTPEKKK